MALEAAQRIVDINGLLAQKMGTPEREALMSEQRQLWDAHWPRTRYEAIERVTRH